MSQPQTYTEMVQQYQRVLSHLSEDARRRQPPPPTEAEWEAIKVRCAAQAIRDAAAWASYALDNPETPVHD